MKLILSLVLVIVSSLSFGQRKIIYDGGNLGGSSSGVWLRNTTDKQSDIEGSYFLFGHNLATGVITMDGGKQYKVPHLNYNAKQDQLEATYSEDSIFVFNSANIEKVVLSGKIFITHLDPANSRISYYEIIDSSDGMKILKKYRVSVLKGSSNPMTLKKLTSDKYVIHENYFLAKGQKLSEIKLKKKYLLKLFKEDSDKIKEYVSKNDLSFKDEEDVKQIFEYHRSLDGRVDS